MVRSLAAALSCALLFSTDQLHAQQLPTPPPPADQTPVFSVSSTLVQVDAEVTDSKQRHVTDLQADDFEVTLDHKVQSITNFSYVHLDGATGNGLAPGAKPSSPVQPEYVRRCMVIVVDDLGLSFQSMYYVRRALRTFVDEQMQPGDLVALWETGHSNSVFQQLTSDKRLLDGAVDSLRWNPQGHGLLDAFREEDNPFEGQQIPGSSPTTNDGIPKTLTPGEQDEKSYLAGGLASAALSTLYELTNELLTVGGRKAVVLFSDGFPQNPLDHLPSITEHAGGSPLLTALLDQMRNLIDRANRSGTVFYTIDARGLQYVGATKVMELAASQQPLVTLAEDTGGFAAINTNGLADALGRVRDDQQGYYLIAFKAPANIAANSAAKNIDFHSLRVRLKRKGLHVRSRSGFLGETDAAARPEYKTPEAQMRLAAFSLFNRADIHVRLAALYTRSADAHPAVRNLLYIDAKDISFKDNKSGKHEAHIDILVMASGSGINGFQSVTRRLDILASDDELSSVRREGIVLILNVPLKSPGPYQVRASVRDGNSAQIGSAGQFLDIPDLKKVHLALTTPMVSDASGTGNRNDPSVVLREFHAGSNLSFVSLLETDRDATAKLSTHDFAAGIRLYSDGKQILGAPVPVRQVQGQNVHALKAEIRLNDSLPAGQYYLQATATDNSGKTPRSTSTWTDFQIVP